RNYTVSENPGLGDQGLYYYYHAMPKALAAANVNTLKLADGKEADWRKDLGEKLLALQQSDGSWKTPNGRWMESNPVLVTAYIVLALEQIDRAIPK
ncbi:MAG TPA: cycloartenol synthase, partial [Luteolibacter sp.]